MRQKESKQARHREAAGLLVCGLVLVAAVAIVPKPFSFSPCVGSRPLCAAFPAAYVIVVVVEMLDLEIAAVVEWAFAKAGCPRCVRGADRGQVMTQAISISSAGPSPPLPNPALTLPLLPAVVSARRCRCLRRCRCR